MLDTDELHDVSSTLMNIIMELDMHDMSEEEAHDWLKYCSDKLLNMLSDLESPKLKTG